MINKIVLSRLTILIIFLQSTSMFVKSNDDLQRYNTKNMDGGRLYFELTSGSQQWNPSVSPRWSFRIGAGLNIVHRNVHISGGYSITGIEHHKGTDFPQTLFTHFHLSGGWMFQDRLGHRSLSPMASVGHVSDRIMPQSGETELQFDGWGGGIGLEGRYVIYSTFKPGIPSSAFWQTHFIKLELQHLFTERSFSKARASYHIFFNGYQLTAFGEYNIHKEGLRGWLMGLEFGFSWFNFRIK